MRGKKSMRNRMIRIKIASLMAGLVAAVSLEAVDCLRSHMTSQKPKTAFTWKTMLQSVLHDF